MRIVRSFKPALLLVMAMALMPLVMPATTSAQTETIYTTNQRCRSNVSSYSVQLQSNAQRTPASAFPQSVTLHFADGSTAVATSFLGPNLNSNTYRLDDSNGVYRQVDLLYATAQFNAATYPNYRFTVTAYPCDPVPDVFGTIVQQGNMKPVAGLDVCLVDLGQCTTTDANGAFRLLDVQNGTYTLTSDGPIYKPLTTTVTVAGTDIYLDLIQQRGGGR